MNNRLAFLDTIAYSEGTWGKGDNGYNVLFGGALFASYAAHPAIIVRVGKLYSTAAGRYQLLARYYKPYCELLHIDNFCPHSQDMIALQQIKERKAMPAIDAGYLEPAIICCSNIWASFPGNSYGQRTHSMQDLKEFYVSRGGTYDGGWNARNTVNV